MEVISVGTKRQVTCGNCGSELRWSDSDVRLVHSPKTVGHYEIECMPEREDHYQGKVTCPICKASVSVNASRQLKARLIESEMRADHDL